MAERMPSGPSELDDCDRQLLRVMHGNYETEEGEKARRHVALCPTCRMRTDNIIIAAEDIRRLPPMAFRLSSFG